MNYAKWCVLLALLLPVWMFLVLSLPQPPIGSIGDWHDWFTWGLVTLLVAIMTLPLWLTVVFGMRAAKQRYSGRWPYRLGLALDLV